jgi:hypothetical protein
MFSKAAPYKTTAKWVESQATGDALNYLKVINQVSSYGKPEGTWLWDISARVATFLEEVAMNYESMDMAYNTCITDIQALIDDNKLAGKNPEK